MLLLLVSNNLRVEELNTFATQPSIQFEPQVNGRGLNLTNHHQMLRLRMYGPVPHPSHMPSMCNIMKHKVDSVHLSSIRIMGK
jgi:hypothetical protein